MILPHRLVGPVLVPHFCACTGPRNGEPLCPCRMQNVKVVNGRYVETIDHGPAS